MKKRFIYGVIWGLLCLGTSPVQAEETIEDVASGRLIVKLKDAVALSGKPTLRRLEKEQDNLQELSTRNGLSATWVRPASSGAHVMKWSGGLSAQDRLAQIRRLRSDPSVEYAVPDRVLLPNGVTPNDPFVASQWYLNSTASNPGSANLTEAWSLFRGSAAVIVAVVDTGVLPSHPELVGRLLPGYDFVSNLNNSNDNDARDNDPSDPGNWVSNADAATSNYTGCPVADSSWHGTFVAGVIAGNSNNGVGIAGADWNARILPVRALGKCGGLLSDVVDGMRWAAGLDVPGVPTNTNPAQVINLSLGSGTSCSSYEQNAVNEVTAVGSVVLAAAGNNAGAIESPARCANVIAVGAVDKDGSRAPYSAVGPQIALMAPGGYNAALYGLGNNGTTSPTSNAYGYKVGTSFSVALASATAAMLKGVNPSATPTQILSQLQQGSRAFVSNAGNPTCVANSAQVACNCTTGVCGSGMLDAALAIQVARGNKPLAAAALSKSGGVLTIDGTSSSAVAGRTIASYRWEQISGPVLLSAPASQSVMTMNNLPTAGDILFKLTVQDSVGNSHSSYAFTRLDANDAPSSQSSINGMDTMGGSSPNAPSAAVSSSSGGGGGGGGALPLASMGLLLMVCLGLRLSPKTSAQQQAQSHQ